MLLNDMEESTRARVEPKEFNSQTMSMLLKFLYTGTIEQVELSISWKEKKWILKYLCCECRSCWTRMLRQCSKLQTIMR